MTSLSQMKRAILIEDPGWYMYLITDFMGRIHSLDFQKDKVYIHPNDPS